MSDRTDAASGADGGDADRLRQVEQEILARAPEHDLVPSLDRVAEVVRLLGDPQRSYRAVHVTGTNGKTSTTRMVERLLREHGLRTGRFTSPHLLDVRERISLDGEPLSPDRFVAVYEEVLPYLDLVDARSAERGAPRLTFFEVLVAMAYAAFADAPVDVAAVEVGMGGAWDATNVLDGEVAVVTPVALDHERFLGHDVASIAREKAGIVKPGAFVVLAQQSVEAAEPLLRHCAEVGATVAREGLEFGVIAREVAVGGQLVTLQGLGGVYEDVFLPLHGAHQAHNAACALAAVEALLGGAARGGFAGSAGSAGAAGGAVPGAAFAGENTAGAVPGLDVETVRTAFADADSPGRLEIVRRGPTVLVDAAHNPAGAAVLADAVEEAFSFTRLIGVVGVMADKDAEGILGALEPLLDEVVVTRSTSPRAMDPDELAEIAVDVFDEDRVHTAHRLDDAVDLAIGRAEYGGLVGGGVLVAGSIPLAADVRRLLGRAPVGPRR